VKANRKYLQVVIADDHPVVLNGLKGLIETDPMFDVIAVCSSGYMALEIISHQQPELAVLDISMPGLSGIDVLAHLGARKLKTRVIFLTASASDREIVEAVNGGAYGLMLKDAAADALLECLRAVAAGRRWLPVDLIKPARQREDERRDISEQVQNGLTSREREIIALVVGGQANKDIARAIGVTEGTVKIHLHNIYKKLGVNNRTALTALALSHPDHFVSKR